MYSPDTYGKAEILEYVDANYGSDQQIWKSTTGILFTFNDASIIWISKRQTCIALSSTESEYIALALGGKESVWIARLYSEITLLPEFDEPICLSKCNATRKESRAP